MEETKCFVICPIGDELAPVGDPGRDRWERSIEVWAKVIEPACVSNSIRVIRADQIAKPGEITEQVIAQLRDADVVIADITDGNPNVMYELGLRHAVGKCTIQISEYGRLPFDIAGVRTVSFTRSAAGLVDGRNRLQTAIAAALESGYDAVTAARLLNASGPELTVQPAESVDSKVEGDGPGTFELLAALENDLPELAGLAQRSTTAMKSITTLAQQATSEMQLSDGAARGFNGRLRIANNLAAGLDPIAAEFETLAADYEERLSTIDAGMTCLLDLFEQDPSQLAEATEFVKQIQSFVDIVRGVTESQSVFAGSFVTPGKFSKPLRISTRRIAEASRRIGRALAIAEVWGARLQQLMDKQQTA